MKIYGRTRYQTQAFVDQNCWIHSFQDPATLDGVLLAAQTNFTLTSTHHSVPQILAPFPTVILQGRGQALDKVLEVGVLQGPPQCLVIVSIHWIQVHPQRARKQNWVLQTKKRMLLWKNAQVIIFHLQKTFVFIIILYSVPVINS